MFKAKRASLKLHPLTTRLVQYKQLLDKLEAVDQEVVEQIEQVLEVGEKGLAKAVKKAKNKADKENSKSRYVLMFVDFMRLFITL